MVSKQKNLFLYLAVACFIGIILIFVFDGYMGLYDTLTMTSGEQTQTVAPEQWSDSIKHHYPVDLWPFSSGNYSFSYVIDNRHFTSYQADLSISVWKNQVKVADVLSSTVNVGAFQKETISWVIDPLSIVPALANTDNQFTLEIDRGNVKRSVIVHYNLNNPKIIVPSITTQ
jgi:hypothetical protein